MIATTGAPNQAIAAGCTASPSQRSTVAVIGQLSVADRADADRAVAHRRDFQRLDDAAGAAIVDRLAPAARRRRPRPRGASCRRALPGRATRRGARSRRMRRRSRRASGHAGRHRQIRNATDHDPSNAPDFVKEGLSIEGGRRRCRQREHLSRRERAFGLGVAGRGTRPRRLGRKGEGLRCQRWTVRPHPSPLVPPDQVRGHKRRSPLPTGEAIACVGHHCCMPATGRASSRRCDRGVYWVLAVACPRAGLRPDPGARDDICEWAAVTGTLSPSRERWRSGLIGIFACPSLQNPGPPRIKSRFGETRGWRALDECRAS